MKAKREVLLTLLHHTQHLLSEPELFAQAAQAERAHDRDSRRYRRVVENNVARIQRLLNDAESLWTFGDQQLS